MAKYPHPISNNDAYKNFINAATYNEGFRQALYDSYQAKVGTPQWDAMKQALTNNSVCAPGQEKKYLDQIVKIQWQEVYKMELALGRDPEDAGGIHPLMG